MHGGQLISEFPAPEEWMFHQRWCSHLLKEASPQSFHIDMQIYVEKSVNLKIIKQQIPKVSTETLFHVPPEFQRSKSLHSVEPGRSKAVFRSPRKVEIWIPLILVSHGLFGIFGANLLWPHTQTVQNLDSCGRGMKPTKMRCKSYHGIMECQPWNHGMFIQVAATS